MRPRWSGLPLVLLAAAAVRLGGLAVFPDLATQDSPDYLVAAHQLATGGGLDTLRVGEWRAPGYVVFLAGLRRALGANATALMVGQALCGLVTVAAGWWLGGRLGGRIGALALALFFALHPAYLLFEHTIHPEALGLALLVTGTALAVGAAERDSDRLGFAAGFALAAAALTRPNLLPFGGALLAGLVATSVRFRWRWAAAAGLGFAILLGPWLVRQQLLFGQASLTVNLERSRLIYLAEHALFDAKRACPDAVAIWRSGRNDFVYDLVRILGDGPEEAEARAREVVARQLQGRLLLVWRARLRAAATFAGIPDYDPPAAGRHGLLFWLDRFVRRPGEITVLRRALRLPRYLLTDRLQPRHANFGNDLWATLGELTLRLGRPLVLCLALALGIRRLSRRRPLDPAERVATVLFVGQLATAVVHGWYLADYDRFAVLFDWVPVAVLVTLLPACPRGRLERVKEHETTLEGAHECASPGS